MSTLPVACVAGTAWSGVWRGALLGAIALALSLATPAHGQSDLITSNFPVVGPVVASSSFSVANVVANIGNARSRTYPWVILLLYTNSAANSPYDWLDQSDVTSTPLEPGERRTNIHTVYLPNLPAGTYYLGAVVDADDSEVEVDELNNFSTTQPIQVVHGLDLSVRELESNPVWTNGEYAPIRCAVTNLSQYWPSDYVLLSFYLSTDPVITTSDLLVDSEELYLGTGVFADTVSVPQGVPPGNYYLGAIVNSGHHLAEIDESNNTLLGPQVEVRAPVDLMLLSCTGPPTAIGGWASSATAVVSNVGAGGNAVFRVGYYLSDDALITTNDLLLGKSDFIGIGGVAVTNSTSFILPSHVAPGTYYLGAIADFDGFLAESNEVNNTRPGTPLQVIVDADIGMVTFTPGLVVSVGGTLPLGTTITNVGALPQSEPFHVGYFASTNPVVTTNDIFLGEWQDQATAPFGLWLSKEYGFFVTVSNDVPSGTYYVGAFADWRNRLAERVETNNVLIRGPVEIRDAYRITLTEVRVTGTNVAVGFPTVPGRSYDVERTASLAGPASWTTITGPDGVAGTGGTTWVPDPAGLRTGQRFYRVRLRP